jgi:integral membrane sensor domain MASE1
VTLAYFAVATLAIQLTGQAGNVAALWFAGAVLLAALMRHEPSAWPALLLLGLVADLAASLFNGSRPPVALAVASADVLEVLLAAAALRRLAGDGPRLASAGWMGLFALAALLAPAAAAALGAGLLALLGEAPFAVTWPLWFAADALGLLIATPFLLSWTDPELRPDGSARALLTALLLGGLVLAVALLVFVRGDAASLFLTFPVLLLATFGAGLPGATAGAVALAGVALWSTLGARARSWRWPSPSRTWSRASRPCSSTSRRSCSRACPWRWSWRSARPSRPACARPARRPRRRDGRPSGRAGPRATSWPP